MKGILAKFNHAITESFHKTVFELSLIGTGKEKEYFIENLTTFLGSGMGISGVLEAIRSDIRSGSLREVLTSVKEEIDGGSPIWKALQKFNLLPDRGITLIRIGEESGRLEQNLKALVDQQQKERSFQSKIRAAMMYPLLVMGLTVIIGIGVAWFILPRLAGVFVSLRIDLPLITKGLIALGVFLGTYGYIAVPIIIISILVAIYFIFIFRSTRGIGQWLLFHIPGVKNLIQETELARFGFLLGSLMEAGMPIVESIQSLSDSAVFYQYRNLYHFLAPSIEEGNSFHVSFSKYPNLNSIIPTPVQQLIAAAERSGHLAEAFLKIGTIFQEKTDISTKNLSVILEPILLVIVWAGVVTVALAVILPIYSLIGGLDQSNQPVTEPAPVEETAPAEIPPAATPVATSTPETSAQNPALPTLTIAQTELGYLNVRETPSSQSKAITRVQPGDQFSYRGAQEGWYEIKLPDGTFGWVAGKYVILPNSE